MKLKNNTGRERILHGPVEMYTLPARGEISITERELIDLKRHGNTKNWLHKGYITVEEGEPEPKPEPKPGGGPDLPEGVTGEGTEVFHHGAGWYSVFVNGMPCTDKRLRKDDAEAIAADYE